MKNKPTSESPRQSILLTYLRRSNSSKNERGIALLMTLIMGALLIAGANALIIRQLTARKLGASESYQQMAETAAISGFNRILSQLNNPTRSAYKGYLYSLDNNPNDGWNWKALKGIQPPSLEEACVQTNGNYALPTHPQAVSTNSLVWPTDTVPLLSEAPLTSNTLRDDGKTDLQSYYRLRSFESDFASNQATGIFTVEGLVKRAGSPNSEILARTLLTRSIDIKFVVASPNDWAIINAAQFADIGNITIDGKGLIAWNVDKLWPIECSQSKLKSKIAAPSAIIKGDNERQYILGTTEKLPLIWPVIERGIPGSLLYEANRRNDTLSGEHRVWSFDDSDTINRGDNCVNNVACVRDGSKTSIDAYNPADIAIQGNTITIEADQICKSEPLNSDKPCHMYVEYMNLNSTQVLIENSTRPVTIHLLSSISNRPDIPSPTAITTGTITLNGTSKFCGVDNGSSECNEKPEMLIITNDRNDGNYSNYCNSDIGVVEFGGEGQNRRLPSAWVSLQSGTVKLNEDTKFRGVLWAQNLCSQGHNLTVLTNNKNNPSKSIVEDAEDLWLWRKNNLWGGNGRQTLRGIRGSGMDLFEKF